MTAPQPRFIEPAQDLEALAPGELAERLGVPVYSGHRADFGPWRGQNFLLDRIVDDMGRFPGGYEDQCSARYYVDLFDCVRRTLGDVTRLVEVGVFMGGATSMLAGMAHFFGLELDLIDVSDRFLRFTHERVRRTWPETGARVRLFHGDLPSYVRDVLSAETGARILLQHDGAHDFNQVVRDLGSLYYVRDRVHSLAIQDTHLRGMPKYFNFVDAAVAAVFGYDMKFEPIGTSYVEGDVEMTSPNPYQGNYFLPDTPEGMYLRMSENRFRYPHPAIPLEAFFERL